MKREGDEKKRNILFPLFSVHNSFSFPPPRGITQT